MIDLLLSCQDITIFQAVDVWSMGGLFFVIGSLLEGALANYIDKYEKEVKEWCARLSCFKHRQKEVTSLQNRDRYYSLTKRNVNKVSRVIFPIAYGVFNAFYWVHYTEQ